MKCHHAMFSQDAARQAELDEYYRRKHALEDAIAALERYQRIAECRSYDLSALVGAKAA